LTWLMLGTASGLRTRQSLLPGARNVVAVPCRGHRLSANRDLAGGDVRPDHDRGGAVVTILVSRPSEREARAQSRDPGAAVVARHLALDPGSRSARPGNELTPSAPCRAGRGAACRGRGRDWA